MGEEEKHKKEDKHDKKEHLQRVLRRGYGWKVATVALFALLIISIFTGGFEDLFSSATGTQQATEAAMNYINTNLLRGGTQATLKSVTEEGGLYKLKILIGENEFDTYTTKDGKFLFPQGIDMTEESETPETPQQPTQPQQAPTLPKTAKPVIDVFVMSHCPYGTQIEKGILPVVQLLKDKIEFNLRFVYYIMHGEKEVTEQLNQYCIQKEQKDKLITYLTCFLDAGDGAGCLTKANIDTTKLTACTKAADTQFQVTANLNDQTKWLSGRFPLFNVDKTLNEKYGVGGSPSLVINGQEASSGRDSASLLRTICAAFDKAPAECSQTLSSAAPSPGFGGGTGANSGGSCG
ncbi:thioredoxin family protein [Candidatus Woesearchaeota archaeon]|nr:thioredoxin family protein [Candidatus Woesearchaeota archaeon]